jgi:DNA polymerase III subunit delta'
MRFSDIRDQGQATATLERAIGSGKVPHAYLFVGPSGVGKRFSARILASALCCDGAGEKPCGVCFHCRKIASGTHPDVRILAVPEDKRKIPIEAVREAEKWLSVSPHEARSKVLIVDPAEEMTEAAANAILKTLEEPRPGSFIVLVTAAASALLPTVRSRCQIVRFRPLDVRTVVDILAAEGIEPEVAEKAAAVCGGSLERAREHSGAELVELLEIVEELLTASSEKTPSRALKAAERLRGDRAKTVWALELALTVLEERLFSDAASPGGGAAAQIAAVHRALTAMDRNNMNPQLALEGVIAEARGRRGLDGSWHRIGGR